MQPIIKLKQTPLRVAHESETIRLRRDIIQLKAKIKSLSDQLNQSIIVDDSTRKIALPTSRGTDTINIDQVMFCKADGNYTSIYVQTKMATAGDKAVVTKYNLSKPLKAVAAWLNYGSMCRCHQSYLVNMKYVIGHTRSTLLLVDNLSVNISRRNKKMVMEALYATVE